MDVWRLISNDHTNITELCRDILRSMGGGVNSRDRLFDQLDRELKRHLEAEEESIYDELEDEDHTEEMAENLVDEHDEIRQRLAMLRKHPDKDGREWTQQFEDFMYLLDRHFYAEEHELFPAARGLIQGERARHLRHEYVEEKMEALRSQRRWDWDLTSPALIGALSAGAAGLLALAAWRYLGTSQQHGSGRRTSHQGARRRHH